MLHRKQGCSGAGRDTNFGVDVTDVVIHGIHGNRQLLRNLFVGLAAGEQTQDFNLAVGQAGYQLAARADPVTCSLQDRADCLAIQSAGLHLGAQWIRGSLRGEGC